MSSRSNIFQRVVAAVHGDLGPGWNVEESRFLTDTRTGEQREVDVVAEALVGGYPITISIEVRDRGRAADVTWVESMAQKHADLPTSKLVLWSSTGFSESALIKARALGIETIAPGGIDRAPWASLARQLIGASIKFLRPSFDPVVDVRLDDGTMTRWPATKETVLKQRDGDREARVGVILSQVSDSPEVRSALLDHAPAGSGSFHAVYEPPFPCTVRGPNGEVGELARLIIGIETLTELASVVTRTVVYGEVATTLAEAGVADGVLRVVAKEPATGSASLSAVHVNVPLGRRPA